MPPTPQYSWKNDKQHYNIVPNKVQYIRQQGNQQQNIVDKNVTSTTIYLRQKVNYHHKIVANGVTNTTI